VEHREVGVVLRRRKLENLGIRAGFLCTELVAREGKDVEALGTVFVLKRTQTCVLAGKASIAGNVDDEQRLALVLAKVDLLARDRRHGEVVQV
jgi:hypothetical protein